MRGDPRRRQAENPLIALSSFPEPALSLKQRCSFTNTVNIIDSSGKVVTIFQDINISILPGDPFSNMDKDSGNALIVDAQVFAKWQCFPPPPWQQ